MEIKIETMCDEHDCETCGWSYAEGGDVYIDGVKVINEEPVAYCYDSENYDVLTLLCMALREKGITVEVDGNEI